MKPDNLTTKPKTNNNSVELVAAFQDNNQMNVLLPTAKVNLDDSVIAATVKDIEPVFKQIESQPAQATNQNHEILSF